MANTFLALVKTSEWERVEKRYIRMSDAAKMLNPTIRQTLLVCSRKIKNRIRPTITPIKPKPWVIELKISSRSGNLIGDLIITDVRFIVFAIMDVCKLK